MYYILIISNSQLILDLLFSNFMPSIDRWKDGSMDIDGWMDG